MKLWIKAMLGLILGVIFGTFFPGITYYIKPVGDIFIQFIKMMVMPLVGSTIIVGIASIRDSKRLGRVGIKAICLYIVSAAFAITIGLTVGNVLFSQSDRAILGELSTPVSVESHSALETVLAVIPNNPLDAICKQNILQVIAFSLLLGIGLSLGGKKTQPVIRFFEGLSEGFYQLTSLLMELAIFGNFVLIAYATSTYGTAILIPLGKVLAGIYAASLIHIILILGGSIWLFGKFNFFKFFRSIFKTVLNAFQTSNAVKNFPIKLRCIRQKLHVSPRIARSIVPFGSTINMDGTAIYQGVAVLFVAHCYGIDFSTGQYATIVSVSTLASIGMASFPGAGLIVLIMVLSAIGLPLDAVALIAGLDRVLDMIRTTTNVVGDCAISYMVARSEKEIHLVK